MKFISSSENYIQKKGVNVSEHFHTHTFSNGANGPKSYGDIIIIYTQIRGGMQGIFL